MDFRTRIIGYCSTPREGDRPSIDVSSLLLNLLLFDAYVLKTHEFTELSELIELFDYKGVVKLVKSGALQFDPTRISAVGVDSDVAGLQSNQQNLRRVFLESDAQTQRLGNYEITVIRIGDDSDSEREMLTAISTLTSLSKNRQNKLLQAVQSATSTRPGDVCELATSQTHLDLDRTSLDLCDAISKLIEDANGAHPDSTLIKANIHRESVTRFHVESNLENDFEMSKLAAHCVIGNALLSLTRCNTSLAHMHIYSAVTGMPPDEQRFLDRKLGFLTGNLSANSVVDNYQTVMELSGLPTIAEGIESWSIDFDRFLEVRASQQCAEFREWLRGATPEDEIEAAQALNNLWTKAVGNVKSMRGRQLRYAAVSGIGLVSPPAGIALGALDEFFLEKLLPTSGPSLLLSADYPSMFRDI